MSKFREWLSTFSDAFFVPLFDADEHGFVRTRLTGRDKNKRTLCRSQEMEQAMVDLVTRGFDEEDWCGILYVMGWGERTSFRPLYIGKANRWGRTPGKVSANLAQIRTERRKFGRWGDGSAYHIGDLSQALFKWEAYKGAEDKYERWAEMLFVDRDAAKLREPTSLMLIPWRTTSRGPSGEEVPLEQGEEEAIEVAIEEFEDIVLNVAGETWWAPQASAKAQATSRATPGLPVRLVEDAAALRAAVDEMRPYDVVGLDVETTLYTQELCLVQLGCADFTVIVDVKKVSNLEPLGSLLTDEGTLKVIHNASFEKRVLGEAGFRIGPIYDTLKTSRLLRGSKVRHRLDSVCERELGIVLDKGAQTSQWDRRPLTQTQLDYAALDAEVLVKLHEALSNRVPELPLG